MTASRSEGRSPAYGADSGDGVAAMPARPAWPGSGLLTCCLIACCLILLPLVSGCSREEAVDPRKPDEAVMAEIEPVWEEKELTYRTGIYATETATLTMTLDSGLYAYYRSLPRYLIYANYVCYMNDERNQEIIRQFVARLLADCQERELDDHETIRQFAAFVQSMEYIHDIDSTGEAEWPKYPIETFYDGGGDCEDLSIVLASALRELGYQVCFILFDDHVGVGVEDDGQMSGVYYEYEGVRYFYIETTAKGWDIGGVPEEYYCLEAKLILVKG